MTVYLIHFDRPIGTERQKAEHYLGSAKDLEARLAEHRNGTGARLLQVLRERGIGWQCVRTWEGGRDLERRLKKQKHAWRHCPVCRETRKP